MIDSLGLLYGAIAGLSLGLTGGGGSLLALPLLVYGLGVSASQAVGTSLAAVGAMALAGAIQRWRAGQVESRVGWIFAFGGMAGAPLGSWVGRHVPPALLLVAFAVLMILIAVQMWRKAVREPRSAALVRARIVPPPGDEPVPFCPAEPSGRIRLDRRCGALLGLVGIGTGVLSGLFGVGGGFVIVPALVSFTRMSAHRAVATSLMVIALICASGFTAFLLGGGRLPLAMTTWFVGGGLCGMALSTVVARKLSPVGLQKLFSVVIVLMALLVLGRNLGLFSQPRS